MPPKPKSKTLQKNENTTGEEAATTSKQNVDNEEEETSSSDNEENESSNDESDTSSSQSSSDSDRVTVPGVTNVESSTKLSCLKDWDSQKMNDRFQSYVSKLASRREEGLDTFKFGLRKLSKVEDFTPWWDDFSKPKIAQVKKQVTSISKQNADSFDNWFSKSCDEESGSNWLSGSSSAAKTKPPDTPVEDIEVPSIYDQTPQTKGRRQLKKERKAEREKTLGKKWFEMKAPEVDDATRMDMEMIRMRGVLDPKRFYKHNDRRAMPKYFQMGKVVDEGTDYYSSRLTKKQRKQTLVEELMADANVRQYNKRKYSEVQQKMRSKKKFKGNKSSAS